MNEWDRQDNESCDIGLLTIYTASYDGDLDDLICPFGIFNIANEINCLRDHLDDMHDRYSEDELLGSDLIGLNSNSFKKDREKHHLFLEWDRKQWIPEMDWLMGLNGMVVETDGGFHYLEEADLDLGKLVDIMGANHCCEGYTGCTEKTGHACLRVSPKGENRLRIVKDAEGFLYGVYKELVEGLA